MAGSDRRLAKLSAHLHGPIVEKVKEEVQAQKIAPNMTRSFSEYARDVAAMMTENVAMTERHGGDLVAEVLKTHAVDFIFCLSGGHISPILVSSEKQGIRIVDVRHEVNAVFAADAVSRLTGKPGVCAVTAGPGVTNTLTALKNCAMAQSGLVLLGGAAATVMQGRGALQDIDQLAFLKPVCKWVVSCRTVRDIVPALRRAFQEAQSGVPGPVFVELPLDVLYPVLETLPQAGTHSRLRARDITDQHLPKVVVPREATAQGMDPKAFVKSKGPEAPIFVELPPEKQGPLAMRMAFKAFSSRLHAGAHDRNYDFSPLQVTYPRPQTADVSKVAEMIRSAKRPLFLLQSQCMLHGSEGARQLAEAIESLGAPCFLGGMARGLLGRKSNLHVRQNRGKAIKKADLVCLFGVSVDFRLDYGRALPKHGVVNINRSPDDIKLNTDLFWKPTFAAVSDPSEFLVAVAEELSTSTKGKFADWAKELKASDAEKEAANQEMAKQPALGRYSRDGQPLVNPIKLYQDLDSVLGDDAILVADGGDCVATASYVVRPSGPLTWLDPGAFGTLGVGGGFALGAALVHPEKQVYIIWGDGSCGYSLLEFDTFARHGLNVCALVATDSSWQQISREQMPMFSSDVSCVLDYTRYEKAAEGLGGRGLAIESPKDDTIAILKEAQRIAKQDQKPVLVNVFIGQTSFREGSISV